MPTPDKQVTSVQCIKVKKKDSSPEFTLKMTWTDNTCTERTRNYNNISDFMRILNIISPDYVDLPVLKDAQKFLKSSFIPLRDKKKTEQLDKFFKDLFIKLPNKVLTDERFISFFEISSANELKLKYSKILESAQSTETHRTKSETLRLINEKFEDIEEKYSSLKLNPEDRSFDEVPETYQLPENFLASKILESNYEQIKDDKVDANQNHLKKGSEYWVIRNFKKERAGEVDMEKGDSVSVIDRRPNGQWLVYNKDTKIKGWIPKEILLPDKTSIFSENDDMEFVVVDSYKAVNSDEVSVDKGDLIRVLSSPSTGWWMVRNGNSEGRIPGSCIGVLGSKKLQSIPAEKDEDRNSLQTSRNIEEMYSKVEKTRIEKGKAPIKNAIERLPSYENLREIISTENNNNQKENQDRNSKLIIPSVYVRAGDVPELSTKSNDDEVMRGKSPKKLNRTESDSRQSWSQSNQRNERTPSYNDEPKQRNSSDAKNPHSNKRLSFPSLYYNLKPDQKSTDDQDLYDNVRDMETTIEKCNKGTIYAKNDGSNSTSPSSPATNSNSTNERGGKAFKSESDFKLNLQQKSLLNQKTPSPLVSSSSTLPLKPALKTKPTTNPKPQIPSRPGNQTPSSFKPKPKLPLKPKEKSPSPKEFRAEEKKDVYQVNDITKAKADELLQLGIRGAFLFRVSNKKESAAILSIFDGTRVRHINVERDEDGELTIGNSNFNSMPEIANYFKQNPVARNASGEELKLTKHLLVH